jgi:hypothetical protein
LIVVDLENPVEKTPHSEHQRCQVEVLFDSIDEREGCLGGSGQPLKGRERTNDASYGFLVDDLVCANETCLAFAFAKQDDDD